MAVNVYEVLIWSCLAGIATVLGAILLFFVRNGVIGFWHHFYAWQQGYGGSGRL